MDLSSAPITAVAVLLAGAALAQTAGMTFRQVQQRYYGMNEVHIAKCDWNGDDLIDSKELNCVQGIYRAMYTDR